ncbi:MAG: HEAT repeat domain-containing protein [candidate division Zixibacteria bacterium]|nr:HEAT repeat domain-containing protein [candidate division Zixibacteria bacterium]
MRRLAAAALISMVFFTLLSARGRWGDSHSDFHYARDRAFDLIHVRLEISFDEAERSLSGKVTHTFTPILPEQRFLFLDAVGLKIEKVSDPAGNSLAFEQLDEKLKIDLGLPFKPFADTFVITIEYGGQPKAGLYFVQPDSKYPRKRRQIWTQGETEDTRLWIPIYDYPNDRATSEVIVIVPEKYLAVSNGELVSDTRTGGKRVFHWREGVPHVTYLISLVAGEYEMYSDTATLSVEGKIKTVPLLFYHPPGEEEKSVRSFGKTGKMMRFFSEKIGVFYPYEKYSQATIDEFMWGGMENISATTQTERTLHDRRAHQDFKSEGLVAHELAHQWWGDLLTCRDWSHVWLNEGFATYFDALFQEYDLGSDQMPVEMREGRDYYMSEDRHYRRPIVTQYYSDPLDVFDSHTYPKGGWVLHMLRNYLGEELWWKGINHYCKKHYAGSVVTADFEKAMEEATGKNLDWFFQQWVYKAGYPEFKIRSRWDDSGKVTKITVEQTQETDSLTPLFRVKLPVVITTPKETVHDTLWVDQKEEVFYIPSSERPKMVEVDPRLTVLKKVDFERAEGALRYQLEASPIAESRREAAEALGKFTSDETVEVLAKVLKSERFFDVRREAALSLGKIRGERAKKALFAGLSDDDSRVRLNCVKALASFSEDAEVVGRLKQVFAADTSYAIVAEILTSISELGPPDAFEFLQKGLLRSSHNEVISTAALKGLAELKDLKAADILFAHTLYGRPFPVRSASIEALGKLGHYLGEDEGLVASRLKEKIKKWLVALLGDPKYNARLAAIEALGTFGDEETIDELKKAEASETHYQLVKASRQAIESIRTGQKGLVPLDELRARLEGLEDENKGLRQRIEALEKKR